eukprot:13844137-Alexandrium_andersonii.AAC.1
MRRRIPGRHSRLTKLGPDAVQHRHEADWPIAEVRLVQQCHQHDKHLSWPHLGLFNPSQEGREFD